MKYVFLLIFHLFIINTFVLGQEATNPEISVLQAQIKEKGINETLLQERLLAIGIDLGKITPEEYAELASSINKIIDELAAQKAKDEAIANAAKQKEQATIKKKSGTPRRGQSLFAAPQNGVIKNNKAQDFYILSTGDELSVSIFGASQYDARFEINEAGFIQPSNHAKIFLKGLRLGDAKELIRSRFSRHLTFRREQCVISLINPRKIAIHVYGETNKHGTQSFTGTNTAIDALQAVGGPNAVGSMRMIQLIRGGEKKEIDVYKVMEDPALAYQYYLEEGDILHIPIAEKVVSIQGEVLRPMRYELKYEEGLLQLLSLAGGLKANAYKKIVQIKRFGIEREEIIDVPLSDLMAKNQEFPLQNGDVISIKAVASEVQNFVVVKGGVAFPGSYSLNTTPHISDLLIKGVLLKESKLDKASLIRDNPDGTKKLIPISINHILKYPLGGADLKLMNGDKLIVYKQERFIDKKFITVTGAVRDTIEYPYDPASTITVERAIFLAGGLQPDAADQGYIIRSNPQNKKEKAYIKVAVRAALDNPDGEDNIKLEPFDELRVLTNTAFSDQTTVKIIGAVRNPGAFPYHKSLTLEDLITLSGGLSFGAALNRIDLFRVVTKGNKATKMIISTLKIDSTLQSLDSLNQKMMLHPYDEIVVRRIPDFEFQKYVMLEGEVKYPGKYALLHENERLSNLIQRAGGLSNEAFAAGATLMRVENSRGLVVTHLNEALKDTMSKFNYILKDGDVLTVPKNQDLVAIKIANTRASELYPDKFLENKQINVAFDKEKKAKWYIKEYAVGFGKRASRKNVTVEYPNGHIKRTKRFLFLKFYPVVKPGSIVSVGVTPKSPKRVKKANKERQRVNWEKVLSNTFQALTLGVTTVLLVRQL
jgi:protein involved in polysaccharide export with SLBB domain